GALDVAGGDVEDAVSLAGGVDRKDGRMVDLGQQLVVAEEPLAEPSRSREFRRDDLERDTLSGALREVDDTGLARAEQPLQPVAADRPADVDAAGSTRHRDVVRPARQKPCFQGFRRQASSILGSRNAYEMSTIRLIRMITHVANTT